MVIRTACGRNWGCGVSAGSEGGSQHRRPPVSHVGSAHLKAGTGRQAEHLVPGDPATFLVDAVCLPSRENQPL